MIHHVCELCGYEYDPTEGDPENGIEAGTEFEDLPDSWTCPLCGATKEISPRNRPTRTRTRRKGMSARCCGISGKGWR